LSKKDGVSRRRTHTHTYSQSRITWQRKRMSYPCTYTCKQDSHRQLHFTFPCCLSIHFWTTAFSFRWKPL